MKTLCDYELSLLAKEAGFDMDCHDAFMVFGKPNGQIESGKALKSNSELQENECTRPQLNDLQDWLLEKMGVWVEVTVELGSNFPKEDGMFRYDNYKLREHIKDYCGGSLNPYPTKDQALSEGMKSYLKSEEGV